MKAIDYILLGIGACVLAVFLIVFLLSLAGGFMYFLKVIFP